MVNDRQYSKGLDLTSHGMLSGEQRGLCRVLIGERKQGRCGWVVIECIVIPGLDFMVSVRRGADVAEQCLDA